MFGTGRFYWFCCAKAEGRIPFVNPAWWLALMSRPHPSSYKTKNWPAYNEALKQRGSLTIWSDPDMT